MIAPEQHRVTRTPLVCRARQGISPGTCAGQDAGDDISSDIGQVHEVDEGLQGDRAAPSCQDGEAAAQRLTHAPLPRAAPGRRDVVGLAGEQRLDLLGLRAGDDKHVTAPTLEQCLRGPDHPRSVGVLDRALGLAEAPTRPGCQEQPGRADSSRVCRHTAQSAPSPPAPILHTGSTLEREGSDHVDRVGVRPVRRPVGEVRGAVAAGMMVSMSIPVDLAALGEELDRRDTAYLLISGDARPHVVEVSPELVDGVLVCAEPGRTARRIIGDRPAVSFLLPPREPGGYSLIVDGDGALDADGRLTVVPSTAVLHRASRHQPHSHEHEHDHAESECGNDCRPLDGAAAQG